MKEPRRYLYSYLNEVVAELKFLRTPFLGGEKPNNGDLAVFGILRALAPYPLSAPRGIVCYCSRPNTLLVCLCVLCTLVCSVHEDILNKTKIVEWELRMTEAIGTGSRVEAL